MAKIGGGGTSLLLHLLGSLDRELTAASLLRRPPSLVACARDARGITRPNLSCPPPAAPQAVIAAVNGLSQAAPSYPYVFKAQTPASPTKPPLPNVRTQLPTFTPSSPPPPAPEPPSDSSGKDNKSKSSGGGNHSHKNGSGNGGGNSNSGGGNRRLLGTWVRPAERGSARALLQSKSGGICPKDSSFIVQQKEDCTREWACVRVFTGW